MAWFQPIYSTIISLSYSLQALLIEWSIDCSTGRLILCRSNEKIRKKFKPLPLNTVELQKRVARYLHISSEETMRICESLYQIGYVSYPRTETAFFSEGTDFTGLIGVQTQSGVWGGYAQGLLGGRFVLPRKGKGDDHAHPPIHPTKLLELSAAQSICK